MVSRRCVVAVVLVVSLVSGCTGNQLGPKHGGSIDEQRAELLRRPSLEEIKTRYNGMLARMRDDLTAAFPWMRWKRDLEPSPAFCAEFDAFSDTAQSLTLDIWLAEGGIPDAEWPRAQQIVADIGREYGFGEPRLMVDRPGIHDMVAIGRYLSTYSFGSEKNTTLAGTTGCHLPQAVKDNPPPPTDEAD